MAFKKIIATTHYEMDYGGDGIIIGLYEQPGVEITEWPYCRHNHNEADIGYPLFDGKPGFTSPPGFIVPNPLPPNEKTREEVFDTAKDADLIVVTSCRHFAVQGFMEIVEHLGNKLPPVVLCDGEDAEGIPTDIVHTVKPSVFFKREMPRHTTMTSLRFNDGFSCPVFPLPFSAFSRSYEGIDDQQKDYDIFLSIGITYPKRVDLLSAFLTYGVERGCRYYVGTNGDAPIIKTHPYGEKFENIRPWRDYMEKQAQSKITASMRGWGRDALHASEAFSFETLVLYCPPGITMPYPPQMGVHCVEFSEDCHDIPRLLDYYLAPENEEERKTIARAGKEWLYKYHTNAKRVEYLLRITKSIMNGETIDRAEFGL